MAATRRSPPKRFRGKGGRAAAPAEGTSRRFWSREVTERSNALDLEEGVFTLPPHEMALSLERSAELSTRRKSSPFRSAMSMLTFYENRAGRNLSPSRKQALREAKDELRKLFGRQPGGARRAGLGRGPRSGRRAPPASPA